MLAPAPATEQKPVRISLELRTRLPSIPVAIPKTTALITGASGGIGKEAARQLTAAGVAVFVGCRTVERGQRAVEEIGGNARSLVLDVTDAASVTAAEQVERLDVLVNNAVS